jgi:hypothetical protein
MSTVATTTTLVRDDGSAITVPIRAGAAGIVYVVDPQSVGATIPIPGLPAGTVEFWSPPGALRHVSGRPTTRAPDQWVFLYQNTNFDGWAFGIDMFHSKPEFASLSCPCNNSSKHPESNGTFNDQASSFSNGGPTRSLYQNSNFSGASELLLGHSEGSLSAGLNDEGSSIDYR